MAETLVKLFAGPAVVASNQLFEKWMFYKFMSLLHSKPLLVGGIRVPFYERSMPHKKYLVEVGDVDAFHVCDPIRDTKFTLEFVLEVWSNPWYDIHVTSYEPA